MEEEKTTKVVAISEDLHTFIKRKQLEPKNKGRTIAQLVEESIMNSYGIDEKGEPLLNGTTSHKVTFINE